MSLTELCGTESVSDGDNALPRPKRSPRVRPRMRASVKALVDAMQVRERDPKMLQLAEDWERHLRNKTASVSSGVSGVMVDTVLSKLGKTVRTMAFDFFDGTPTGVQHGAVSVAKGTWGAMQPVLRESILGPVPGDYSTLLLVNWATAYPVFWRKGESLPQPYTWLRARYLYAVYPADVTTFNKMKNPLYLLIMGLKLYSSLTGVPIFILQWFFIDKKDEFQVVNFILSFKAYQVRTPEWKRR